jgi:hypothetical protein
MKRLTRLKKSKGDKKKESTKVKLSVNDVPIELDYFVQRFIGHVVGGILDALKGKGEIMSSDIFIEGKQVTIHLNNVLVPINTFVNNIIRNTIVGMVTSLKGVSEINRLNISIKR